MSQPIQAGTVADRLRNFLKLSGRIPVQMDENVVPVVNAQDLGSPPWRTEDSDWMSEVNTSAAVVARFAFYIIRMPAGAAGVGIVKSFTIRNASGAAAEFSALVMSNVENEATLANFTALDRCIDAERIDLTPTSAFRRVPLQICTADGSDLTIGYEIFRILIPTGDYRTVNLRLSLRGKYQNGVEQSQALGLVARLANSSLTCTVQGEYYPQAL